MGSELRPVPGHGNRLQGLYHKVKLLPDGPVHILHMPDLLGLSGTTLCGGNVSISNSEVVMEEGGIFIFHREHLVTDESLCKECRDILWQMRG